MREQGLILGYQQAKSGKGEKEKIKSGVTVRNSAFSFYANPYILQYGPLVIASFQTSIASSTTNILKHITMNRHYFS